MTAIHVVRRSIPNSFNQGTAGLVCECIGYEAGDRMKSRSRGAENPLKGFVKYSRMLKQFLRVHVQRPAHPPRLFEAIGKIALVK